MKIIELFEEEGYDQDEAIELIRRDCKPYFDMSPGDRLMYRGMRGRSKTKAFKRGVRADRRPKDTEDDLHEAMDDWFLEKFGFRARSNAMFATGHATIAGSYGSLYAVFPIGDFEFVWSPNVDDLTAYTENLQVDEVPDTLRDCEFRKTNLRAAIDSQNEIMVSCREYYAVPLPLAYEDISAFTDKLFQR